MESFYLLIPIALIFVAFAIRLLFWAINSGQYDNLDTEAHRILFDEDEKPLNKSPAQESPEQKSSEQSSSAEKTAEKKAPRND